MNQINNFEDYCKALKSDGEILNLAIFMLMFRSFFVDVQYSDSGNGENKTGYVGIYDIFRFEDKNQGDELSRIAVSTIEAAQHIAGNFRESLVRENVMMPINRVKEISSAGLNWLSHRSGRNVYEKLSATKNFLGVQKRLSIDTAENRLFKAFLEQMTDFIEKKISSSTDVVSGGEEDFLSVASNILRSEKVSEISRWENLPPNNTLLSDRFYRQIWRGWLDLQNLSELLKSDFENFSKNICIFFFWFLLFFLHPYLKISQRPMIYDYKNLELKPFDSDGENFVIKTEKINFLKLPKKFQIEVNGKNFSVAFEGTTAKIFRNGREIKKIQITVKKFEELFQNIVVIIFQNVILRDVKDSMPQEISATRKTYADIFSLRPIYFDDKSELKTFSERILRQEFFHDEKIFDLSASEVFGLKISCDDSAKMYSISSCMNEKIPPQDKVAKLFQLIQKNFSKSPEQVQTLSLPVPDIYNEFQISVIRRAARLNFKDVQTIPRSLAFLFSEVKYGNCGHFKTGDFALVVDYICGKISFTLVKATYSSKIKNYLPETRGITWTRQPTSNFDAENFEDDLQKIILSANSKLTKKSVAEILKVFNAESLIDEIDNLTFEVEYKKNSDIWLNFSENIVLKLMEKKFDAEKLLQKYLSKMSEIIGKNKVFIFCISPSLTFQKTKFIDKSDKKFLLEGMKFYDDLQTKFDEVQKTLKSKLPPLWADQLPYLAIKRLFGAFDLIPIQNTSKILPEFGVAQKIPVKQYFTLPKGKKEFHFGLILSESKEISFEAAIKHRAFPLSKDTQCVLDLTYTYGKDIPYNLIFKPVSNGEFLEAKVEWKTAADIPYQNLPAPTFPKDNFDWENFQNFKTKKFPKTNLLEWIERAFQETIHVDFKKVKYRQIFMANSNEIVLVKTKVGNENILLRIYDNVDSLKDKFGKISGKYNFIVGLPIKRYKTVLRGRDWMLDNNGHLFCIKYVNQDFPDVIFYLSELDVDELKVKSSWEQTVTFEIMKNPRTGRNKAVSIMLGGEDYVSYKTSQILSENVPYNLTKMNVMFPLHTVYANGRNSKSGNCPAHFKKFVEKFMNSAPKYLDSALKKKNSLFAAKLFRVLCVMLAEADDSIFNFAHDFIENRKKLLHEDLGALLGNLETNLQVELLKKIFSSNIEIYKKIAILNRAAWKSEKFILNAPTKIILQYLNPAISIAIDYKNNPPEKILRCLEFILATFRLRKLHDKETEKFLSLRNENFSKLYAALEEMIVEKFELPASRLEFEIPRSSEYKKIPDFVYALLICITGGGDEIKISGINEESSED